MKKYGLGIILLLLLMSCSQQKKIDKFWWDPVKGVFRITYGITK